MTHAEAIKNSEYNMALCYLGEDFLISTETQAHLIQYRKDIPIFKEVSISAYAERCWYPILGETEIILSYKRYLASQEMLQTA